MLIKLCFWISVWSARSSSDFFTEGNKNGGEKGLLPPPPVFCLSLRSCGAVTESLLIITGTMGSGKTTVLAEASDILALGHIMHAAIRDRAKLLALLLLTKALADKDPRVLELAIQRSSKGCERQTFEKLAGWELACQLAKGLRGAELILWTNKDGVAAPGLRCDDILSALYVLAVLQFKGGVGLGACIMCGNPFVQKRKTRKTCSDTCRYNLHMKKKALRPIKRRKA
jgi:hypothetical protein